MSDSKRSISRTISIVRSPELLVTILIATTPLLGYGGAFVFELGYCLHFRVPVRLIQVSWGSAVLFGGIAGYVLFNAFFRFILFPQSSLQLLSFVTPAIVLLSVIIAILTWSEFVLVVGLTVGLLILPLALMRSSKLRALFRWKPRQPEPGELTFLVAVFIIGLTLTTLLVGRSVATHKSWFFIDESGSFIHVASYGESHIFCGFDNGPPPRLNGKMKVRPAGEAIEMERRAIGPFERSSIEPAGPSE